MGSHWDDNKRSSRIQLIDLCLVQNCPPALPPLHAVLMTAMMSIPWPLPSEYPPDCRYATLLQIRWVGGAVVRWVVGGAVACSCTARFIFDE